MPPVARMGIMKVPAPWLIGATHRCRSPSSKPKHSTMVRMRVVTHRKLCSTAFGVPDVPPVNLMPLTSPGTTSGHSGARPVNASRSSRARWSAPSKGSPAIRGWSQVAKRCAVFASVKMMSGSARATCAPTSAAELRALIGTSTPPEACTASTVAAWSSVLLPQTATLGRALPVRSWSAAARASTSVTSRA